jgi:hypothetical protein
MVANEFSPSWAQSQIPVDPNAWPPGETAEQFSTAPIETSADDEVVPSLVAQARKKGLNI